MDKAAFAILCTEYRERSRYSKTEVANQLHVKLSTVSHWEDGTNIPSGPLLLNLANLFELTTEEKLEFFDKAGRTDFIQLVGLHNQLLPSADEPSAADSKVLETDYFKQVAAQFALLPRQFGLLSTPLRLDDVYLDLPIIEPANPDTLPYLPQSGQQWSGKPLPSLDTVFRQSQTAALVGVLGMGKTTTLRYLAWVYAERPVNRLNWRQGKLVPFYTSVRRLAQYWSEGEQAKGTDGFIHALATAVANELSGNISDKNAKKVLQKNLADRSALVLLDALDEFQTLEPQRGDFVRTLQNIWLSNFSENQLLLTSRPYRFLQPNGFKMYILQLLHQDLVDVLVSRLGTALLKTRLYVAPSQIRPWLQKLKDTIHKPQFQEFWSPFYVTLMVHLGTSKPSPEEGIALLEKIRGVTSLYDIFIRETIEWERQKGKVEGADERDLRRVLAYLAYYTFVEPQLGEWLEDAVVGASRLETKTVRSIREFWLKTGLLDEDSEQHTIRFQHNGFLSYAVAYAMADLWHAGQRDKVDELCRRFESDATHSLIVTLFLGLSGQ